MISERVLPHRITVSSPSASTTLDEYHRPIPGAPVVTVDVPAFIQRASEEERVTDEGTRLLEVWRMMTQLEITARDTVEWDGKTFEVEGAPTPAARFRGTSHWESTLRRVEEG